MFTGPENQARVPFDYDTRICTGVVPLLNHKNPLKNDISDKDWKIVAERFNEFVNKYHPGNRAPWIYLVSILLGVGFQLTGMLMGFDNPIFFALIPVGYILGFMVFKWGLLDYNQKYLQGIDKMLENLSQELSSTGMSFERGCFVRVTGFAAACNPMMSMQYFAVNYPEGSVAPSLPMSPMMMTMMMRHPQGRGMAMNGGAGGMDAGMGMMAAGAAMPSAPPPSAGNNVRCGDCHKMVPHSKFCSNCGAGLSKSCESCNEPLAAGAKFCAGCGAAAAPSYSAATSPNQRKGGSRKRKSRSPGRQTKPSYSYEASV